MNNDFVSEQNLDDFLEIREESSNIITENDIKLWSRCSYAYFQKKHLGLTRIPQSGTALEAMIFQQARKALMRIRSETGRLFYKDTRVGLQFKTLNELTAEELPKYLAFSSPESFGNAIFGRWMIIKDKFAGKEVTWNYKSQKFTAGKELQTACTNYYKFILEHETPLPGYINKDNAVSVNGLKIRIKFPEIRLGMIVDDPTIWSFNAENQFDNVSRLEDSALVTLRVLAFAQLASTYPGYARVWGVSEKDAEEMSKNIISPNIRYRHLNASKSLVSETFRTKEDLDVLNRIVDKFAEDTEKGIFIPNHKYCQGCGYNVLNARGDIVCNKVKKGIRTHVPERYFKKSNISIRTDKVNDTETNIILSIGPAENKQPVILSEYKLDFSSQENIVTSRYNSNIRGIGFEDRIINEMDKYLQKLSDEKNTDITHGIDFNRDFKYAGQKNLLELLDRLGYKNMDTAYIKTYNPTDNINKKNKNS
jgi:hypothetical protein